MGAPDCANMPQVVAVSLDLFHCLRRTPAASGTWVAFSDDTQHGGLVNIQTILVPTDFSDDADQALTTAIELAGLLGAGITVVHAYSLVVPMATPMMGGGTLPQEYYDQMRAEATAQVERATDRVTAAGIKATGVTLPGPASTAIVSQAEQLSAGLIVMGTRGLSGLKHVMLGSVAERVVRTASCPVLTVKSHSN